MAQWLPSAPSVLACARFLPFECPELPPFLRTWESLPIPSRASEDWRGLLGAPTPAGLCPDQELLGSASKGHLLLETEAGAPDVPGPGLCAPSGHSAPEPHAQLCSSCGAVLPSLGRPQLSCSCLFLLRASYFHLCWLRGGPGHGVYLRAQHEASAGAPPPRLVPARWVACFLTRPAVLNWGDSALTGNIFGCPD